LKPTAGGRALGFDGGASESTQKPWRFLVALAALGYVLAAFCDDLIGLCAGLSLPGAGSSTQHPTALAAVSHAYCRLQLIHSAARRGLDSAFD